MSLFTKTLVETGVKNKLKVFSAELRCPATEISFRIEVVDLNLNFEIFLYKGEEKIRRIELKELLV